MSALWIKHIDTRNRFWRVADRLLRIHYFDAQRIAVASTFGFARGAVIIVGGERWEVARVGFRCRPRKVKA